MPIFLHLQQVAANDQYTLIEQLVNDGLAVNLTQPIIHSNITVLINFDTYVVTLSCKLYIICSYNMLSRILVLVHYIEHNRSKI